MQQRYRCSRKCGLKNSISAKEEPTRKSTAITLGASTHGAPD